MTLDNRIRETESAIVRHLLHDRVGDLARADALLALANENATLRVLLSDTRTALIAAGWHSDELLRPLADATLNNPLSADNAEQPRIESAPSASSAVKTPITQTV